MSRTLLIGLAAAAALLPGQASAQPDDEVSMFSRGRFTGARYTLTGPTQSIRPAFDARSVRITTGEDWEFCTGSTFTGCRRISKSMPSIVMTVRSARPVAAAAAAAAASASAVGGTVRGLSLRGTASEYFVAPETGGSRIEVDAGAADSGARRADDFCRSLGWASSSHEAVQAAGGRSYLVDVLCVGAGD